MLLIVVRLDRMLDVCEPNSVRREPVPIELDLRESSLEWSVPLTWLPRSEDAIEGVFATDRESSAIGSLIGVDFSLLHSAAE